jgi:hypothetical protein
VSANPPQDIVRDRVDIIEVNYFYDDQAELALTQLVFWEWKPVSANRGQLQVVDWRKVRRCQAPIVAPTDDGGRRLLWHDQGALRDIRADEFRISHTQWDPELVNRSQWPQRLRRRLTPSRREPETSGD